MNIDWNSSKTEILLNPRLDVDTAAQSVSVLPTSGQWSSHIWLATSGSSAANAKEIKYAALSKAALLGSAQAVCSHLNLCKSDVWINSLPYFHVGGLAVSARRFICGMQVVELDGKWQSKVFFDTLHAYQATFSSLVPAQVFDLVTAGARPPKSLKAVLVGGGQLSKSLYDQALTLGWRLLPSYGMTEASSTIAAACLTHALQEYPSLEILPHVAIKIDEQGLIMLKGKSLFTTYAYFCKGICRLFDPKVKDGWFLTEDRGALIGGRLSVYGRSSDFVKIGGENVELPPLRALINEIALQMNYKGDLALVAVPDARLGCFIALAASGQQNSEVDTIVKIFQGKVLPYEKIRKVHFLPNLPVSPSGKMLNQQIVSLIS